jgi:hypothetical protein
MIGQTLFLFSVTFSTALYPQPLQVPPQPNPGERIIHMIHDTDRRFTKRRKNKNKQPKVW